MESSRREPLGTPCEEGMEVSSHKYQTRVWMTDLLSSFYTSWIRRGSKVQEIHSASGEVFELV